MEVPVEKVKGVGESVAKTLHSFGVKTALDLIENVPRAYSDYSEITPINQIKPGTVTVQGKITNTTGRYIRRGMHITEAIANDETGSVKLVWFNQPYRAGAIKSDAEYFITGEFGYKKGRVNITSPSVELV